MNNSELVRQAYSNFETGNIEAVLNSFDPAIEWNECKGMPFVKGDGIYIGPQAVLTNVFMPISDFIDGFQIEVSEIFGADDKVTMVGYYRGTNKATGHPFKANATHVWTLKNEKATRFFQAVDTAVITS